MKTFQWLVLALSIISLTACGKDSNTTENKTNLDTVAPIITVHGANPLTVVVGNAYIEAGASAIDDVDGTVSVATSGSVNTDVIGAYSIAYTALDNAGNIANEVRAVEVVSSSPLDEIAPVITLNGNNPMTLISGNAYVEAGATAIDDKDGVVSVTIAGRVDASSVGDYTITYTALDVAANVSNKTRMVYVRAQTTHQYVTPSDVGVTIGAGANGSALPTEIFTASKTITAPTLIENKVINGCLWIKSNDVTIRNSIINCDGYSAIRMDTEFSHLKIEYSKLECTLPLQGAKAIKVTGGAPYAEYSHNEFKGCEDFFYLDGNIDGTLVENNYMHDVTGDVNKAHSDGFQIGEQKITKGKIHIQGNYFEPNNPNLPKTALLFATHDSEVDVVMEDNYIDGPFGRYTIRCMNKTKCDIKNNVFSNEYTTESVDRILLTDSSEPLTFSCNRYANGDFVEKYVNNKDVLAGVDHVTINCGGNGKGFPVNQNPQLKNLKDTPTADRFVRPLEKVWPAQANDIDIALWKDDKFAAVSITIDDNIIEDHDYWTQISQQYGWKFTWFIIVNKLGKGSDTYGNWSDFQTLLNQGHDVESHTLTHTQHDDQRPDIEIEAEYGDSLDQINQNITTNDAQTISYPYGDFKRDIAAKHAIAGRDTSLGLNKPERTDYLGISSTSIQPGINFLDAILKGTSGLSYLGNDRYTRGWFLSHFHHIDDRAVTTDNLALLAQNSGDLWIGLFKNIAKYGQERDTARIDIVTNNTTKLVFDLSDDMDDTLFDHPLTLKIKLHSTWSNAMVTQNDQTIGAKIVNHENEKYVLIQAVPDKGLITLTPQ